MSIDPFRKPNNVSPLAESPVAFPSNGRRSGWQALSALLLLALTARAQEPDLLASKDPAGHLVIDILPDVALPDPLAWNLYRGALTDLPSYLQYGDPDGRCAVPGIQLSITLADELSVPGNFYYLLTAVPSAGTETTLGFRSDGVERSNTFPCPMACGTGMLPAATIRGTEGIAMASDGTAYYSQRQAVGRRLPGMAPENAWVPLPGATTVWGLALRADGMLFVGSPSAGGNVYRIDTTQPAPTPQVLYPAAGSANGLTIGPDDAVYYSDFNAGIVYRLDDAGTRQQVTASTIPQSNGLLFDDDGTLLVLAYGAGQVWRLTLDATMTETSRVLAGTMTGSRLDGIAKDLSGRYYLSDNGGGRLLRVDADFLNTEVLLTGTPAAANIVFGQGDIDCLAVHVASSGALGVFISDVTGRP